MKVWRFIGNVLIMAFLAFVIWLFIAAGGYNASIATLCEEHGMVVAKEYPWGQYGCAEVIPFDELEER